MATQTTTTTPPAYQLPYLQYGLNQAKQLYSQGTPVIPFAPQSEAALSGVEQRATNGSPLVQSAQDYAQKSLSGGFLGSNPYLDQTFNQAALATQNQLASQFAGSGRNVDASMGLRSQQLNDLATKIYGGNYQNERALQQGVLGSVLPLANQDYVDLAQLRGVGSDVEGLAREYAQAPGQALDQYLGRVSGNMGQTTSQPLYRNSAGSILGGALLGSQLGSSVSSNPYAGVIGAIGGGLLGAYGGN
jgi:hypothetical protein